MYSNRERQRQCKLLTKYHSKCLHTMRPDMFMYHKTLDNSLKIAKLILDHLQPYIIYH